MTKLDPEVRSETGRRTAAELRATIPAEPATPVQASWRDFIYAEVWSRPGLDRRARFIIAITGAANKPGPAHILESYIRGALETGELTLAELREAALHLTGYSGWSEAATLDEAITRVADALGLPPAECPPLRAEPWDPAQRTLDGQERLSRVMVNASHTPTGQAFIDGGILNYVFGELWTRPGLDQRSRRLITLVGAADTQSPSAVRSHAYSAMASGDLSVEEMCEFVLQYTIHGGHTRGSTMHALVLEMAGRIAKGQSFGAAVAGIND